jgi:hypothetical protein
MNELEYEQKSFHEKVLQLKKEERAVFIKKISFSDTIKGSLFVIFFAFLAFIILTSVVISIELLFEGTLFAFLKEGLPEVFSEVFLFLLSDIYTYLGIFLLVWLGLSILIYFVEKNNKSVEVYSKTIVDYVKKRFLDLSTLKRIVFVKKQKNNIMVYYIELKYEEPYKNSEIQCTKSEFYVLDKIFKETSPSIEITTPLDDEDKKERNYYQDVVLSKENGYYFI